MGDQNIILVTDLQNRVEVSNYLLGFQYLPRRIDIAFSLYHLIYYFYTSAPVYGSYNYDHILFRDRYYGAALSAHYPFSKFRRLEFNTDLVAIDRAEWDEFWDEFTLNEQRRLCVSELAYVKDNSVSRHFGPMNGGRFRLSFTASPNLYPNNFSISQKRGIDFYISEADYRRYFKAGFDHSFGLRFAGGASFGDNPARFFLGGVENWINRPYYIDLQESEIEDIYVSKFIFPLRGSSFYELQGTRYFLINSEFRFPFIQYFILGWPIPYPFIDIRGALFMDLGGAWTDEAKNFNLFKDYGDGSRLADALMGFGFGMRFPFPFIGWPTQWDVAWKSDLNSTSKPRYYLSIGYEF